ncbi:hypothetical protein TWF106_004070 [Orbilia oligospora]|uniref:Uncharacterized protein n=1 Tax=Orbilia oligospora TaxID=2813651 RepID=A0A7C8Q7R0_ORBOL|nr:hypothetical protein TWF106_004070 [Orbilia oligospora]
MFAFNRAPVPPAYSNPPSPRTLKVPDLETECPLTEAEIYICTFTLLSSLQDDLKSLNLRFVEIEALLSRKENELESRYRNYQNRLAYLRTDEDIINRLRKVLQTRISNTTLQRPRNAAFDFNLPTLTQRCGSNPKSPEGFLREIFPLLTLTSTSTGFLIFQYLGISKPLPNSSYLPVSYGLLISCLLQIGYIFQWGTQPAKVVLQSRVVTGAWAAVMTGVIGHAVAYRFGSQLWLWS